MGVYWGNIGIMKNQMETTIMENQMEKKMENEMETGVIVLQCLRFRCLENSKSASKNARASAYLPTTVRALAIVPTRNQYFESIMVIAMLNGNNGNSHSNNNSDSNSHSFRNSSSHSPVIDGPRGPAARGIQKEDM